MNRIALMFAFEVGVLMATVALLAFPFNPPYNYYVALAALALIPGRGFPRLMFGSELSMAERLLFTLLISIGLTTVTVFGLLLVGLRLDASSVKSAAVCLAVLSGVAAFLGHLRHRPAPPDDLVAGNAAAFVAGVLIATTIGIVIMNLL